MGVFPNSHMWTWQTTQPMKCLYFDGQSAALIGRGELDSQQVFLYGNATGPPSKSAWFPLADEYGRAAKLCKWIQENDLGGLGWGIEGIVRMNAGFEMIVCNFTTPSLRLLSKVNISAPLLPKELPRESETDENLYSIQQAKQALFQSAFPIPSATKTFDPVSPTNGAALPDLSTIFRQPFFLVRRWLWTESAIWRYGVSGSRTSGENRVKLNMCGFITYYNEAFSNLRQATAKDARELFNLTKEGIWQGPGVSGNRSIALQDLMWRQRYHSLWNISQSEGPLINNMTYNMLKRLNTTWQPDRNDACSEVDWFSMFNTVAQSYGDRINQFRNLLSESPLERKNSTKIREWFDTVRSHGHIFLYHFFEYPDPSNLDEYRPSSKTAQLAISRCKYQMTRLLESDEHTVLNPEESVLKRAVEEVLGTVCSVLMDISLSIEREWNKKHNPAATAIFDLSTLEQRIAHWLNGLEQLQAWLGWESDRITCSKTCAWDEKCFIPMWPLWGIFRDMPYMRFGNISYTLPPYFQPILRPRPTRPRSGIELPHVEELLWQPKCEKLGHIPE
jgi:hypothetical protein